MNQSVLALLLWKVGYLLKNIRMPGINYIPIHWIKFSFGLMLIFVVFSPAVSFGQQTQNDTSLVAPSINEAQSIKYQEEHNSGTLQDFPRLHPLIVHFPIVLIILALIVEIVSIFVFKEELSWVSMVLIVFGFVGAFVATNILHGGDPNLPALSDIARNTFERHERFAHLTELFSGIAVIVKILSHFLFKRKFWIVGLTVILMGCATYTITIAGEMGARLVHIDAIGVQGNQIPSHDMD